MLKGRMKAKGISVLALFFFLLAGASGYAQSSGRTEAKEEGAKKEVFVKVYKGAIENDQKRDKKNRIGLAQKPEVERAYRNSQNYQEFREKLKKADVEEKVLKAFADEMYHHGP